MKRLLMLVGFLVLPLLIFFGCSGDDGKQGPAGPAGTPQPINALFFGAETDDSELSDFIIAAVSAGHYPPGSTLHFVNSRDSIPPLSVLNQYHAILAWTDTGPVDQDSLGNRLADYVDAGGKVVIAMYATRTTSAGITGRIMDPGYCPLQQGPGHTPDGVMDPASLDFPPHPIFHGVDINNMTYWRNTAYTMSPLADNATLIATDTSGSNLIAINQAGTIMAVLIHPPFQYTNNHQAAQKLIANAVLFVAGAF